MSGLNINIPAGKYVVAVSGGVDSVVLLDLLANSQLQTPNSQFIVAHFNHGIRNDSGKDEKLVKALAIKYGLKFESDKVELGEDASEDEARQARYDFLNKVVKKYHAQAIITAHHQDDLIETSIINILRGTGRRGLTSLKNRDGIIRPLLQYPKSLLIEYAKANKLKWREDSTNLDKKYLRNKVRLDIVAKMNSQERQKWLQILGRIEIINNKIDIEIDKILRRGLHKNELVLNRRWFIGLPHAIAKEVIINIMARMKVRDIDKKTIERVTVQIKTLPHGKTIQAGGVDILLTKRSARFKSR